MKRIVSFIIFLLLLMSLCACGTSSEKQTDTNKTEGTTKVTESEKDTVNDTLTESVNEDPRPNETAAVTDESTVGVTEFDSEPSETDTKTNRETAGYKTVYQMNYVSINCENIMQEKIGLPFGCEVVSLAIVLDYLGYEIDPMTLFNEYMPNGKWGKVNPFYAYVGSPTNRTGYGCYAPCVVTTANDYLTEENSARRARNVSGSSMYQLLGYVWSGYPVVIWGTLNMVPESYVLESWTFDGEVVDWYRHSHCVVICGVQDDNFIICDPMVGKVKYPIKDVEAAYNLIYSQAVVIY